MPGPARGWVGMGQGVDETVGDAALEDLVLAVRHLEDLEIFVGQRSRMHPGPGWDVVLRILRRDLAAVRAELRSRDDRPPQ